MVRVGCVDGARVVYLWGVVGVEVVHTAVRVGQRTTRLEPNEYCSLKGQRQGGAGRSLLKYKKMESSAEL